MRLGGVASALVVASSLLLIPSPAEAAGSFRFSYIKFDPAGADATHLNGEYLKIRNTTSSTKSIAGYRIRDLAGHRFTFPAGAKIGAGKDAVVKSGKGTNTSTTFYWGSSAPIWNNDGDKAYLYWPGQTSIDKCAYPGAGSATVC